MGPADEGGGGGAEKERSGREGWEVDEKECWAGKDASEHWTKDGLDSRMGEEVGRRNGEGMGRWSRVT